jgi:hypothetical protein
MLNLNAMFGSCESIFEINVPRRNESVSSTELQMMEMEISTDLARVEMDSAKISSTTMQLDQLLNMYNHVKQYGIDRTFLSLYNNNSQLDSMIGTKFPSCESVDCIGTPTSSYSQAFIAAMEDEGEGIFAKIWEFIKKIIKKIVDFFSNVWTKIKEWVGFKVKQAEKKIAEIRSAGTSTSIRGKVARFMRNHPVIGFTAVFATSMAVLKSLDMIDNYFLGKKIEGNIIHKHLMDADKDLGSYIKGGKSEEVVLEGNQIRAEAENCLKELNENEKLGDNLDKMRDMLNKIDKFMKDHSARPYSIVTTPQNPDEGLNKLKEQIQTKYGNASSNLKFKEELAKHGAYGAPPDPKMISLLQRVVVKLTNIYKSNCDRNIQEVDMLYKLAVARSSLAGKLIDKTGWA